MEQEKIDTSDKHIKYQFTAYVGNIDTEMGLLGEYENEINIIIKHLKDSKEPIDIVAHPVLYMMRHSLELGYKCNFEYLGKYSKKQTSKTIATSHDLLVLHKEFKEHFDTISAQLNFDSELITEFIKYYDLTSDLIEELGATEASSFRYTKNTKGQKIFKSTDHKNVGLLKELYDKSIVMLTHTSDLIAPFTDYVDLLENKPDFKNGIGKVLMTFPSFQLNFVADKLDEQYEKLDQLKWKDVENDLELIIILVKSTCYLTPIKTTGL